MRRVWQGNHSCLLWSLIFFRCIEDYTTYGSYPMKLLMPSRLKFKGNFLKVTRGPEPDEIVWENLEVPLLESSSILLFAHQISPTTKVLHRFFTAIAAILLLLIGLYPPWQPFLTFIGFAFILQSGKYKAEFDEQVPRLDFCDTEVHFKLPIQ